MCACFLPLFALFTIGCTTHSTKRGDRRREGRGKRSAVAVRWGGREWDEQGEEKNVAEMGGGEEEREGSSK